jgi:hypothetical protein
MTKRRVAVAVVIVALIVLIILLLRGCKKPVVATPAFDYFFAKAEELGRDPARVAKFVREDVRTLAYKGHVKGALGTLWDGAGSPEDKQSLVDAILKHCPGAGPVAIEGADAKAPVYALTILHRGTRESRVYEGPIRDLVGDVHSIDVPSKGRTRFRINGVPQEFSSDGAAFEEVVFVVQRPGSEPLTVVRELWRRDNRTGPMTALAGDRHDFVVLPARVSPYVREKEELILKNRNRAEAPEAKPYLGLLDYCVRSDYALDRLEKDLTVRAQFETPRILMMSTWHLPALKSPVYGFDLRLNRTAFEGTAGIPALASFVRSFVEAGLEQSFLEQWSGMPTTSTFDIFTRLRDDYPNTCDRRIAVIARSLGALASHGGLDGKATFRARAPDGKTATAFSAVARRGADGRFSVQGPNAAMKVVEAPDSPIPSLTGPFDRITDAALAVEVSLMPAGHAYVLEPDIDYGTEPLVAPGARFAFQWGDGDSRTEQRIDVRACDGSLAFGWVVQTGPRPALGTRTVTGTALADARTHNPWYAMGSSTQSDATSFCVSRAVFAELKAGRAVELTVQGKLEEEGKPRPVAWKGQATPAGTGTHTVKVNGREETLKLVRAKLGDLDVAILDDASYPVGMADKLVEVRAPIRGRVVDEHGLGLGGVEVRVGEEGLTETWPDGRFRLPPHVTGKVRLSAWRRGEMLGRLDADLTAPGREEFVIKAQRRRTELVWITPKTLDQLAPLAISDQAKRHIRRYVEGKHLVVVPNRMVDVAGEEMIAFWALDPSSFTVIGVGENGLHAASTATSDAWRSAIQSAVENIKGMLVDGEAGGFGAIHMMRGAIVAWWLYSARRLEEEGHEQALVRCLMEMDMWEENTNILHGVGRALGDQVRGQMNDLIAGAGISLEGNGAQLSFKLGYLGSLLFLDKKLGGH